MSTQKKYPCPICGTNYPTTKLANFCSQPMCREANTVNPTVAREWRIQAGVACLVGLVANVYEAQALSGSEDARAMVSRLDAGMAKVYDGLRVNWPVTQGWSKRHRMGLHAVVKQVWGFNSEQHAAHVLETVLSLVEDVRDNLRGRAECAPWDDVAAVLEDALELTDPNEERPGCEKTWDAYLAFRGWCWNEIGRREWPLRMWLVGGRFYVAARSRHEAAQIVTKETGIVGMRAKGMPLDAKVWDEHDAPAGTVRDMIPRTGVAGLVGRAA